MKGLYFVTADLNSARAHVTQVLNTSASIGMRLPFVVVAPRFRSLDERAVMERHGLGTFPAVKQLWNFGFRRGGILSFVLFNIPAGAYLVAQRMRGEVRFVYVRASYLLPVVMLARVLRVPCFYETHRKAMTLAENVREALMVRLCSGFVAVSGYVARYYRAYGKPVLVEHDAVSPERFAVHIATYEARARLRLPPDGHVCVYTGSVSVLKGVPTLLEAARLLPGVTFLLVGRVAADISPADAPSNVLFAGQVSQGEVPLYLRAADALLLPHPMNEYSQSPMKLFEYMAAGVPIVASKLPFVAEVVNEKSAVLVEPGNPKALADGVSRILADVSVAHRLSAQAALDVRAHTWERRGERIAKFIDKTLRGL